MSLLDHTFLSNKINVPSKNVRATQSITTVHTVNKDVTFGGVPSNLQHLVHNGVPQAIFLDVILVYLRPGLSVCERPQAVVGHSYTTSNILFPNGGGGGSGCWANGA
jgi:hypothetical protein